MKKSLVFNFIIALSFTCISTSQETRRPLHFDFEDASYVVHINDRKRKILIRKKSRKTQKISRMICGSNGFIQTEPNQRSWKNRLPDRSIITVDRDLETISMTRHGKTISESTFLQSLHKYFSNYPPYKP